MENITIFSHSKYKLSGLYYKIYTDSNKQYKFNVDGILKHGDNAFIYCEDQKQRKYISQKNTFNKNSKKEFNFSVKGISDFINFGILFTNSNSYHEIEINKIEILLNEQKLNNKNNMILYRGTKINYNTNDLVNNKNNYNKTLKTLIVDNNIQQIYINPINSYYDKIINLYKLKNYNNVNDPLLILGIYNDHDLNILNKHLGNVYIYWQYNNNKILNFNNIIKKIKQNDKIYHVTSSSKINSLLNDNKLSNIKLSDNINDILKISKKNKIFVFNGFDKDNEHLYGKHIYDQLRINLFDYDFIFSNDFNISCNNLYQYYLDCSAAIILCDKYEKNEIDIINSLYALNIFVVYNKSYIDNINWSSSNDIELLIRYNNINLFNNEIKKYKNILFLCTDYPGWGGAATNTYDIINWYSKNTKHRVYGVFVHDKKVKNKDDNIFIFNKKSKDKHKIIYKNVKKYFGKKPDLIILRNYMDRSILKLFDCPKYFMIPGIFKQNLNKFCNKLSNDDVNIYVNQMIINTIKKCDKCYTNSFETQKILKSVFNYNVDVLHFNYIPYHNELYNDNINNWHNREYDICIIASDYNRIIKNIDMINKIFKRFPEFKKIVIGKNNEKIIGKNIKRYGLLKHNDVMNLYPKIKFVLSTSYYESCPNVLIEGKYNGCKTLKINNDNFDYFMEYIKKTINNYDVQHNKNDIILLISTQYPFYGGAATLAYKVHEKLLQNNFNSYCVFIDNSKDCDYNPYKLKNTFLYQYTNDYMDANKCSLFYDNMIKTIPVPTIIIGLNYVAPVIGKNVYPQSTVFYYITGSRYISKKNITASEFMANKFIYVDELDKEDYHCMKIADKVVPNSYLTLNVLNKTYPEFKNKYTNIVEYETLFMSNEINNKQHSYKIYDIASVASRYDRKIKGVDLIKDIYASDKMNIYKKICIGENSEKYILESNEHFGLLNHKDTISTLKKTKILLITSKYESYSITLLDGLSSDCIVLSNINVASSKFLDDFFILKTNDHSEWTNKISIILNNYDYFKKIFKFNVPIININKTIHNLLYYSKKIVKQKKNILFISIDKPFIGGCSTNTYNIIKEYQNCEEINPIGIFISNDKNSDNVNPNNYDNIYHVSFDENIEISLTNTIKQIKSKYERIHGCFCKNYKMYICMLWINEIPKNKIIFSPSGLRNFTKQNNENIQNVNNYKNKTNLFNFIKEYDMDLENIVYNNCNYIMPNSHLTFEMINNIYNPSKNLKHPCEITYVDFKKLQINQEKLYDVAFICYSWKRKVKNYDIIDKIVTNKLMDKYNILIIGLFQKNYDKKNITQIDNCSNQEILNYLSKTKLLCIPSTFDSLPNIMKEGIMCSCNIILSKNIGLYDIFDNKNIVNDINNENEWIEKINNNVNDKLNINGYYPELIKNQLKCSILSYTNDQDDILNKSNMKKSGVGIYKLPPKWNDIKLNYTENLYNYVHDETFDIKNIIDNNIYYKLFINNDKYNCEYYHYIIVNTDNNTTNRYRNPYEIYPYLSNKIFIWEINDPLILEKFIGAKYYFLRGNYYDIYSSFINRKSKTILYPATSLIYDENLKLTNNKVIEYEYDYVLYDDMLNKKKWEKMFKKSKLVYFNKPVVPNVFNYNKNRYYDYIFVASEDQITKNRNLFLDFVMYCEKTKIKTKIINIGKMDNINLKYVELLMYDYTDYENMIELFNNSKINLLFSGRDAMPRAVTESIACGCFNIALDTISDGKHLYNGKYGDLLSFPNIKKKYIRSVKSISYKSDEEIFKEIIKYKDKTFDHQNISLSYINSLSYKLNIN